MFAAPLPGEPVASAEIEELRGKLTAEDFRRLADSYVAAVRSVYTDLVKRGESAYSKLVAQPQVKQALDTVDQVSTEVESRLEDAVEEVRVRGEKTLAEVTKQTRSIGERAARATQSVTAQAAEVVTSTSTFFGSREGNISNFKPVTGCRSGSVNTG